MTSYNSDLDSTYFRTGDKKRILPPSTTQEWINVITPIKDELLSVPPMQEERFEAYCRSVTTTMSIPPSHRAKYLTRFFVMGVPFFKTIDKASGFEDYFDYQLKSCMLYYDLFFDPVMEKNDQWQHKLDFSK